MKVAAVFGAGVAVGACAGILLAGRGGDAVVLPAEAPPAMADAPTVPGAATLTAPAAGPGERASAPGAPGSAGGRATPSGRDTSPAGADPTSTAIPALPPVGGGVVDLATWHAGAVSVAHPSRRYVFNFGNDTNGVFTFEELPDPEEVLGAALVKAVRDAEPGSPEQAAALVALRDKLRDPDEKVAGAALALLEELSGNGRLPVAALAAIEDDFRGLPAKHAHRARLAALIAGTLGDDPRLAEFLDRLPRPEEADVRAAVLSALDRTPSPAGRRWIERILHEETETDVLSAALEPDRFGTAVTRASAPGLVTALERRLRRADLPPELRGAAYRALALAGMHAPGAAAALSHASAHEADPKLAAFARDAERAVAAGEANPGVIGHLWARHHPAPAGTTARAVAFAMTTTTFGKVAEVPVEPPAPAGADK